MNERLKEIIGILKNNNITEGINPTKLCKIFEELGPTYIKIGQILSTRVELLPEEYVLELSKLRSSVVPIDFDTIKKILFDAYGNPFDYFQSIVPNPIGSASIAQVHAAYLLDGTKVVIKIKRPNVDEIMKEDIRLLKEACNLLHLNKFIKVMDFNLVLDELYNTTLQELDFDNEVNNLIKFRELNKDVSYIGSPCVYSDLCRSNTIVMEYINGVMIGNIDELIDKKYNLKRMALLLSENYIKQALDDGFFHADPHPNNITIKDDKIVYLDLGMMGKLSSKNKSLLKECMSAIIDSNYSKVASILVDMSKPLKEVDYSKLQSDIKRILLNYGNTDLNEINVSGFIKDFFNLLQSNYLVLDSDITMLIRGVGIIEAVLEVLDKNISLVEVLKNKIQVDAVSKLTSPDTVKKVGKSVVESTNSLVKLPVEVSNLITSLNDGDVKLKLELSESSKHIDKLEKLLHEAIITFIDGILIVCFCFSDAGIQKYILGLFIFILSTILVIKMYIDHKHNGY